MKTVKMKMKMTTMSVPAHDDRLDSGIDHHKESNCDGGETCLCKKPLTERPDHPWTMSIAGHAKLRTTLIQLSLRDPDSMNMYTYNDHVGYGIMEVIENLLLDFDEAKSKDNLEEQWVICEVAGMLFLRDGLFPLMMLVISPAQWPLTGFADICDNAGSMTVKWWATSVTWLEPCSLPCWPNWSIAVSSSPTQK